MWQMNDTEKLGGTCMSYLAADFPAWNLVLGNIYRDSHLEEDAYKLEQWNFTMLVTMHMGISRETGILARTWVGYELGVSGMQWLKLWVDVREGHVCVQPQCWSSAVAAYLCLFSSTLEEAAALQMHRALASAPWKFWGWSGPGWRLLLTLCPCSSFRIPSCWLLSAFHSYFSLSLIPSDTYIHFLWRKSLRTNRFYNCKARVIWKALVCFQ